MARFPTPREPTLMDEVRSGCAEPTAAAAECANMLRLYDRAPALIQELLDERRSPEEITFILRVAAEQAHRREYPRGGTARHQRAGRERGGRT